MPNIRFSTFPPTESPADFISEIVATFERHTDEIDTVQLEKGLRSNQVLAKLRKDLFALGFEVETSKSAEGKIKRPVFFGENARPDLQYEIDAWHPEWRAGLEVEAGRAVMGGNAIYRDLIQALVMVEMDHLILAVPKLYRYKSKGKKASSKDYEKTVSVAKALYGHSRIAMPFSLCVIGY